MNNAPAMADLQGLGFFYTSRDMHTPDRSAARCVQAGASWAAVLAESVDGRRQPAEAVALAADALRAALIRPILYTFPNPGLCATSEGRESTIGRAIIRAQVAGISHVCLDFEPFGGGDWSAETIRAAIDQVLDRDLRVSVSVFTRPAWRRAVYQDAFEDVPVILQVYERARDPDRLRAAVDDWPEFPGVVPAIATYLGDVARLRNDLANVDALTGGARRPRRGLAIWALATTDGNERATLAAWVKRSEGRDQGCV